VVDLAIIRHRFTADPWIETAENAWCLRVRPSIPIEPGASKVHGIHDRDVRYCPTWAESCAPRFDRWLAGSVPMAFNAPFDYGVIKKQNDAAGHPTPAWPWLDPLVWARAMWGTGHDAPGNKLGAVAERLGIEAGEPAHTAFGDALTTLRIARPLLALLVKEGGAPTIRTLGELLDWQRATALRIEATMPERFRGWTALEP
jgi:DNA polymerase III epsilon subunit-like protein